jgi:CDP-diacylglycerol--glycerol-3-phosphate 3-phosphatidyltransferase
MEPASATGFAIKFIGLERDAGSVGRSDALRAIARRVRHNSLKRMNLPNALTILRIFFVPLLVAVLLEENVGFKIGSWQVTNEWLALAIFLSAAATDLLDGYLARRWKQETTIGTLLDPIADKLLVSAALISLVQVRVLPGWMAILVIGREFAVSGLRAIAAAESYTIKASDLGKTKMLSQVVAISCLLVSTRHAALHQPGIVMMWGVIFFALLSAVSYFRKFWRKVDEHVKLRRRHELLLLERKRQRESLRQRGSRRAGARGRGAGAGASGGTIWKPPEVN